MNQAAQRQQDQAKSTDHEVANSTKPQSIRQPESVATRGHFSARSVMDEIAKIKGILVSGPGGVLAAQGVNQDIAIFAAAANAPIKTLPLALILVIASSSHGSMSARNALSISMTRFGLQREQVKLLQAPPDFVRDLCAGDTRSLEAADPMTAYGPIVGKILNWIEEAKEERASDVHFEVDDHGASISWRIDGLLYHRADLLRHEAREICSTTYYISEDLSDPSYSETARQTALLRHGIPPGLNGVRLAWTPKINHGRLMVGRLLPEIDWAVRKLEDLGYLPLQVELLLRIIEDNPSGQVLFGGPVGSGKTTALMLLMLTIIRLSNNTRAATSVEDPAEYGVPGIHQQSMANLIAGMTREEQMVDALKAVLRQDQNILHLGEQRDKDTAHVALHASRSGLFVLSTTHANFADETPFKLRALDLHEHDLFDPSAYVGFVNQRLARKLCPLCRVPLAEAIALGLARQDDLDVAKRALADMGNDIGGALFSHGHKPDCPNCKGRGYLGRTAIAEIISPNEEFMDCYPGQNNSRKAREYWLNEMDGISMAAAGLAIAANGGTSIAELARILGRKRIKNGPDVKRALADYARSSSTGLASA